MEIYLSQYAGFCDGVKRAYALVTSLKMKTLKEPVCILGHLVHNENVAQKVKEKGIKEISRQELFSSSRGEIGTLIITAHGVGPDIYAEAQKKQIELIDTTCPKVIKVQRLAQVFAKRGYGIILVGDAGHKEVEGINAWGNNKAEVVSQIDDLKKISFPRDKKIIVLAQTTQNEDFFEEVTQFVKKKFTQAEIISTLCYATHERQKETKKLAQQNDVMIIIGSPTSANSRRLFDISSSLNLQTYFIAEAYELKKDWFQKAQKVAITAGASTPSWVIEEVLEKIKKYSK